MCVHLNPLPALQALAAPAEEVVVEVVVGQPVAGEGCPVQSNVVSLGALQKVGVRVVLASL